MPKVSALRTVWNGCRDRQRSYQINVDSIARAILALVLVFKHGEVGLVARRGYVVIFYRIKHSTTGFVGVGAVGEPAILGEAEDFLEVAGYFFGLHIEGAKAAYAGRVDDISAIGQLQHLAEGGGVHAGIVGIGNLGGTQLSARHESVDKRGFAYTAVAAEHGHLALKQVDERSHSLAGGSRNLAALISHRLVEAHHHRLIVQLFGREQVGLVEDQYHRHAVSLSRSEETVDEGGGGLRMAHGDDKEHLVDIGGNDVALLGEVLRLAHNVVAPVLDGGDECRTLLIERYLDPVAHSHRIGAAYTLETEVSLNLAFDRLAIVSAHGVPAAGVLDDESLHYTVIISFCLASSSSSIFLIYLS